MLYWLSGTLDVLVSLAWPGALPTPLAAWVEAGYAREPDLGEWAVRTWFVALLAALIAGSLGVFRLRIWGRRLFAIANAAALASYPLLDALVYTWFGGLAADLALLATGAILLGSYSPAFGPLFTPAAGGAR